MPLHPDVATGLSIPVVVLLVWLLVRRIRRKIVGEEKSVREP
jgi:uncharacterized membrane-anchored protein